VNATEAASTHEETANPFQIASTTSDCVKIPAVTRAMKSTEGAILIHEPLEQTPPHDCRQNGPGEGSHSGKRGTDLRGNRRDESVIHSGLLHEPLEQTPPHDSREDGPGDRSDRRQRGTDLRGNRGSQSREVHSLPLPVSASAEKCPEQVKRPGNEIREHEHEKTHGKTVSEIRVKVRAHLQVDPPRSGEDSRRD